MMEGVTRDESTKGGRPILEGTKLSVLQIVELVHDHGMDPDEIVTAYADIDSTDMVHTALTYYNDHKDEIDNLRDQQSSAKRQLQERGLNF
jgi:uncharacterized protein (DUF433 family)